MLLPKHQQLMPLGIITLHRQRRRMFVEKSLERDEFILDFERNKESVNF